MNNKDIFILLSLVSFIIDVLNTNCKMNSLYIYTNNLTHHFLIIYAVFGSLLFGHYRLHVLVILLTILGWLLFKYCILTLYYNRHCGIKDGEHHDNLIYNGIIQQLPSAIKSYYSIFVFILIYDVYNIYTE